MKVKSKRDYLEKQRRRNARRDRKKVEKPTIVKSFHFHSVGLKPKAIKLPTTWFHPLFYKLARTEKEIIEEKNRGYTLDDKIAQLDARKEKK